jgi:hypothetical protein
MKTVDGETCKLQILPASLSSNLNWTIATQMYCHVCGTTFKSISASQVIGEHLILVPVVLVSC